MEGFHGGFINGVGRGFWAFLVRLNEEGDEEIEKRERRGREKE